MQSSLSLQIITKGLQSAMLFAWQEELENEMIVFVFKDLTF